MKRLSAIVLILAMLLSLVAVPVSAISAPQSKELAREIMNEAAVLMKNDNNVLPLKQGQKVAIFGNGQKYAPGTYRGYQVGGGGSGHAVSDSDIIDPITALRAEAAKGKIEIYEPLSTKYDNNIWYVPDPVADAAMYDNAAAFTDTAIMFIKRTSYEGSDRKAAEGDWYLSADEKKILKELSSHFANVIVVLNVGGIIDTSFAVGEMEGVDVDAVLNIWQGGSEGGLACADLLVGNTNPSGKLTDTWAKHIDYYPSTEGFDIIDYTEYTEDVFVGYRYFETFDPTYSRVNFEFGFGLSYTTFAFSNQKITNDGTNITVTVDVKNTGTVAGKEVVQVYFSAPQMGEGSAVLSKPAKELAGYEKTKLLAPNEVETVTVTFPIADMASYDDTGLTGKKSAYVLEAGDYDILVGNSVKEAGGRIAGVYTVEELTVTEQLSENCAPEALSNRLLADGTYETLWTAPPVVDIASGGTTKVEAELYGEVNGNATIKASADGTKYITGLTNGSYADYKVNVLVEGDYEFSLSIAGTAALTDFANIYIDSVLQTVQVNSTATANDETFADTASVKLSLKAGKHTIRVEAKGDAFPNFDGMSFKIVGHLVTDTAPTTVKGADYSLKEKYVKVETLVGGFLATESGKQTLTGTTIGYFNKDRYVEYTLNVQKAGKYAVAMRIGSGRAGLDDCIKVLVDGVEQPFTVNCPQTCDGDTGSGWFGFIDYTNNLELDLPAGVCTLRFVCKTEHGPNIYSFTLTKTLDGEKVAATGETVVEGEKYTAVYGGARTESFSGTLNGGTAIYSGSSLSYMNEAGRYAEYTLNVAEAGTYALRFRIANGRAAANDVMSILVDGVDSGNVFNVPKTCYGEEWNSWFGFIDLDQNFYITLPAGVCKLKFVSKHTNCPTIDKFTLEKVTAVSRSAKSFNSAATIAEQSDIIMFSDVREGKATIKEFLAQMSVTELSQFTSGTDSQVSMGTGVIAATYDVTEKYGLRRADTADGPAGLRLTKGATFFGCGTATASTWNKELAERFGLAMGEECVLNGVEIWLGPGMNIHRNPLCGRNFEYYSEDPLVTGKTAAAVAKGIQSKGVSITLKHLTANNKEANRNQVDSRMSERALREIYLKGFEIAVKEGDAWCIMSSYNFLNGKETSENYDLLTNIIRKEWNFDGIIMTDWGNDSKLLTEFMAGNTVQMPGGSGSSKDLVNAEAAGTITRAQLEQNVEYILNVLLKIYPEPERVIVTNEIASVGTTNVQGGNYLDKYLSRLQYPSTTDGKPIVAYMDQSGSGGVSWISYKLDVKRAGTYKIEFLGACTYATNDVLRLFVNGEEQEQVVYNCPDTDNWHKYVATPAEGEFYLPAGTVELQFKWNGRGSFGNYESFNIIPVALDPVDELKQGDVNGDGTVDTTDLSDMKLYLANALPSQKEFVVEAANFNPETDNVVDTVDLSALKLKLAGAN